MIGADAPGTGPGAPTRGGAVAKVTLQDVADAVGVSRMTVSNAFNRPDRIAAALRDGPKTIPALAEALGAPAHEVVCWVMAMRRYGQVEEKGRPDGDGYYSYELKAAGGAAGAPAKGGSA